METAGQAIEKRERDALPPLPARPHRAPGRLAVSTALDNAGVLASPAGADLSSVAQLLNRAAYYLPFIVQLGRASPPSEGARWLRNVQARAFELSQILSAPEAAMALREPVGALIDAGLPIRAEPIVSEVANSLREIARRCFVLAAAVDKAKTQSTAGECSCPVPAPATADLP